MDNIDIIPKKLHFITGLDRDFGGKPFGFVHYMAIRSALETNPEFSAYVYYEFEPDGIYWDIIKNDVTRVKIEAPSEIFGRQLNHFAHKADVLRLEIMIREGGIYIDLDTICQKPYEPLFGPTIVMGIESTSPGIEQWNTDSQVGLCNALMIAPKNCEFLKIWYNEYKTFNDEIWNEFSVLRPAKLARVNPDIIKIEPPESFFWPIFVGDGLPQLFEQDVEFPHAYSIHLWESASWKYLVKIDAGSVLLKNTTYNKIARKFMEKDIDHLIRNSSLYDNRHVKVSLGKIFDEIYDKGKWGNGNGLGSSPDNTAAYRTYLQNFLSENKVKSVIDFGCGDWQFSSLVDWAGVEYLGIDVAKEVVTGNIEKYQNENIKFAYFDGFKNLPEVDLVICKDVFQHLSNERIKEYLVEMKRIGRRLLITNDIEGANAVNTDICDGEWRAVRIDEWPFLVPSTIVFSWLVQGGGATHKKATYLVYNDG